jgi:hypothetical protein
VVPVGGGGSDPGTTTSTTSSTGAGNQGGGGAAPGACTPEVGHFAVESALQDASHPCADLVAALHGRTVQVTLASGAIWSRRTQHGTGLLVTAAHVFTPCAVDGTECPETLRDPDTLGYAVIKITEPGTGSPSDSFSGHFPLYNPVIPAAENQGNLAGILPAHDISVYVVDPQTFVDDGTSIGHSPGPLQDAELPLHDPESLTTTVPTFASPVAGSAVMLLGYAGDGPFAGKLAATVGEVLSDEEVSTVMTQLQAAGDEEGDVAYDPAVEVFVRGDAYVGMSGGGAFDSSGKQVGTMVRATHADIGARYVRVVRLDYVAGRIAAAYAALSPAEQAAVAPYLEQP